VRNPPGDLAAGPIIICDDESQEAVEAIGYDVPASPRALHSR
jgi:hypothetical protein